MHQGAARWRAVTCQGADEPPRARSGARLPERMTPLRLRSLSVAKVDAIVEIGMHRHATISELAESAKLARPSARRTSPPPQPPASKDTGRCSDEVPPPLTHRQSIKAPLRGQSRSHDPTGRNALAVLARTATQREGSSEESLATIPRGLPHRFEHSPICPPAFSRGKSGAGEQTSPAASRQASHGCDALPSMR